MPQKCPVRNLFAIFFIFNNKPSCPSQKIVRFFFGRAKNSYCLIIISLWLAAFIYKTHPFYKVVCKENNFFHI